MSRAIKFRGQTRRKGEKVKLDGTPVECNWVYGGIFLGQGNFSIIYSYEPIEKYPVYTDTVGQSTGKYDISGKEIFEGDIIESHLGGQVLAGNMVVKFGRYQAYCPVDKQDMDSVGFYVSAPGVPNMPLGPTEDYAKVIGNIFENPDLISKPEI